MAKPSRSHEALQQLLDERKRYEQWVATLESKREFTPQHVYKRVHADYEQRLAAVREQLAERTGEIRSAISGLKERLKQATEQETERVDELHEAELRSVVGEFTPEQWGLRKREVEVDLKRFGDEKKKISEELNQLLLIIEQTADHDMPAEPAAVEMPPPAPAPGDATRVRQKTPSRARAAMHATPLPAVEAEKPAVPIESLAPADGLPAQQPESSSKHPAPASAEPSDAATPQAKAEARAASQGKRSKTSAFAPADPRRESEKTLKCGECGAMNYPTEWYCESCGGELSAL